MNRATLSSNRHAPQFRAAEISLSSVHNDNTRNATEPEQPAALQTVVALPRHKLSASAATMHITVDAGSVTALRHIVIGSFGDLIELMRIQSTDHARKMKVSLSLSAPVAGRVMEAIMRSLPHAEFGRVA